MNDCIGYARDHRFTSIGARSLLAAFLYANAGLSASCGRSQYSPPAARTPALAFPPDGGRPLPQSDRRGVIVPSDTGIGSMPSGAAPSTGTGGPTAPVLGNPGGGK